MSTKKKELSKNTQGVSAFFNEASNYLNLEDLSKDYNLKKYKIKEYFFAEGAVANQLFFIQSGNVKTFRSAEEGKNFAIGLYDAGHSRIFFIN